MSGDKPADNASFASAQRLTFPLLTDEGAARADAPVMLLLSLSTWVMVSHVNFII